MKRKIKIAILTDLYWPSVGGIENLILSISSLSPELYDFRIITHAKNNYGTLLIQKTALLPSFKPYNDPNDNTVYPLFPRLSGRIFLLPFIIWNLPLLRRFAATMAYDFLYLFYRLAFKKQVLNLVRGADIVHNFSTSHLAVLATEICKETDIPIVQSPPVHFGRWGDSPRLFSAYNRADTLVCLSMSMEQEMRRRLQPLSAETVVIPPPPMPLPKDLTPPDHQIGRPFILFLGRHEKHKGLSVLIEAFKMLKNSAFCIIAGPGRRLDGLPQGCVDLGEVSEPVKHWLLSECEIFCLPSSSESFGIVYTEAMSYEKPVIALDVAPVNEIIINGQTGILTAPEDVKALSLALDQLISNEPLRKNMGRKAKSRYLEHYSPNQVLSKIQGVYVRIYSKKNG